MNVAQIFESHPQAHGKVVNFFAHGIECAHAISPVGWSVFEKNGSIVLCLRNVYTTRYRADLNRRSIEGLCVMAAEAMLTPSLKAELEAWNCRIGTGLKNTGPGGSVEIVIPYADIAQFAKALERVRPAHEKYISNVLRPGTKNSWPQLYTPAITEYLREATENPALPHPLYFKRDGLPPNTPRSLPSEPAESKMSIISQIKEYVQSRNYYFDAVQIASFYTALQTKGFVILSGISGTGKTKLAQLFAEMLPVPSNPNANQIEQVDKDPTANTLFISVRPDWRDSKSLLGFYNPLTGAYEWTPFLRFIQKAITNYETDKKSAWFVILDEMNLARVEYYFADLLSVLESGRDENGYTREPLRLQIGKESAASEMPPAEIHLPPNLYFIGTVNIDETTQAFSAKVLDRAFSMEFIGVDFERYARVASQSIQARTTFSSGQSQELLNSFTRSGKFARIDKAEIASYIQNNPDQASLLQELNTALAPYSLHFGYRVFDELMMFLSNAKALRDELEPDTAFDRAVLMKILPKFHGSRGKLEQPLGMVLEWCAVPDRKAEAAKSARANPSAMLQFGDWRFPETARRVLRMFYALDGTGFASFG